MPFSVSSVLFKEFSRNLRFSLDRQCGSLEQCDIMDNTIPAPMPSSARKSLFRFWFVVLLIALAGVLIVVRCSRKGRPYRPPPIAYSGSSSGLKTTVIVPTLDTPLPKERNVIWCSSFGVAWNSLKIDVTKEPVRIRGAEEIAVRLNKVKDPEADLPSESYYAAAGFVSMDIVRTIQDAMARRFPSAPTPGFGSVAADGIIAYAYLAANVKFTIPFFDNRDEFLFKALFVECQMKRPRWSCHPGL